MSDLTCPVCDDNKLEAAAELLTQMCSACADAENIPIGPHFMTEDIDYGHAEGPYR